LAYSWFYFSEAGYTDPWRYGNERITSDLPLFVIAAGDDVVFWVKTAKAS